MKITDYIKDHFLFLDGAMGTMLQKHGLGPGELPERWNITKPDVITEVHKAYYDAGSNVVSTNTFGATKLKFPGDELENIIRAAVENARKAAALSEGTQEKWVALDIGPSGKLLAPYGDLEFEDAVELFAETVKLGAKYGVDLIFIETMNDIYETKAALLAAKENCDLPVFVSNAYGEDGKLMTGASPAAVIAMLEGLGADAVGMNCSLGPAMLTPVAEEYLKYASVPVILKPNAGLPQIVDKKTVYNVLPEEFSAEVALLLEKGVRITGGCCGTAPAYIEATVQAAASVAVREIPFKEITCVSSHTHAVEFGGEVLQIGDRTHAGCNEQCKEYLLDDDLDSVVSEGCDLQDEEVDMIALYVGVPGVDETELLASTVPEMQMLVNLPVFIDATDALAVEKALRCYKGKAMVGSLPFVQERMDAVFPLVKKYGGVVVCLTMDENGIPDKADDRVAIAEKILAETKKYGIAKKNIVFAPAPLTGGESVVSETLMAVKRIEQELGCRTLVGVSNVSLVSDDRDFSAESYVEMAKQAGVSALLMNPYA